MFVNIMLGLGTMILCLFTQTALLISLVRFYKKHRPRGENAFDQHNLLTLCAVMLMLVVGNLAQVAIWAKLFVFLEEFESFAEAFYFSAVNFATLGYGEIIMSDAHKLLGPLEAINGILMVGLSTSSLLLILQDVGRRIMSVNGDKE